MMMSSPNHDHLLHLHIPLADILKATNNFDDKNIIKEDGIGNSYAGELLLSGELIKIDARRFNKERNDREQLFRMELIMLSSIKHKNVVSLVGYCDENDENIIITRLNIRGSLTQYLSDPMLLTWVRRLKICVGIAHALSYIHYDEPRDFSVIHRMLHSNIIVLNDDWEPKLYFFYFSMKIEASQRHHSFHTKVMYVKGYGDPTYIETRSVNHKSDVYCLGIVMLELLCGRESIIDDNDNKYLAPLAITHYRERKLDEIIDWDLWNQMDSQSFNSFSEIAYDCLNEVRSERPNIGEIVTRLEKALEFQLEHDNAMSKEFAHLNVPLENILFATNNFAEENVIREGGFEKRYKGQLSWSGELINIMARRFNKGRDDGEQLLWMEISMFSSLRHKNLVSLVGFCDENDEKIIIYTADDTRGSLSRHLGDPRLLTWVRRLEISVAIAHALSYIHYDEPRDFSVIHRCICSSSVVLNENWEPKLCDFDLSIKIKASQRNNSFPTNELVYVDGYGDPTYIETYSVNHKSDIYSLGIVLVELMCGRKSIINTDNQKYLTQLVITHYKEKTLYDIIDRDLWKQMDPQSFNILAEAACDCLNEERSRRPNIDEIVLRLEKALELQLKPENYDNSIGEGTSSSFIHKKFQHLKVKLQAITSATNGFDDSHCIGKGGFGKVYEGELVHSKGQSRVAIKRLDRAFGQGDREFWKEITMLSLYRHRNIVSLIGFCDDYGEKILLYEYASKRSLDLYLNDKDLRWVQRLEICIGAARGLAYLHNPGQTQQRVLHRDIKSSNILLDENWNARIADFGLSKFGPANQQYTFLISDAVGTMGYCDPLYAEGLLTKESDVYSFGVVLFEILCGRLCIRYNHDKSLTALVRECYKQNTLAEIVYGNIKDEIYPESLKAFTTIAYQCLNLDQEQRPLMAEVVKELESALKCQVANEPPTSSLAEEDTLPRMLGGSDRLM